MNGYGYLMGHTKSEVLNMSIELLELDRHESKIRHIIES